MEKLGFEIIAFDKNGSDTFSRTVRAEKREEFNSLFDDFCKEVPFVHWWYEIIPEIYDLTDKQKDIVMDHEDACYSI